MPYPDVTSTKGASSSPAREADMFSFKVPSLLNIAETGPYLHDGSITTLEEMVKLMAFHQLDRKN
jgi:cytochrome c peroxidase